MVLISINWIAQPNYCLIPKLTQSLLSQVGKSISLPRSVTNLSLFLCFPARKKKKEGFYAHFQLWTTFTWAGGLFDNVTLYTGRHLVGITAIQPK